MKRCSTLLIREMQIKTTVISLHSCQMAVIKNTTNNTDVQKERNNINIKNKISRKI